MKIINVVEEITTDGELQVNVFPCGNLEAAKRKLAERVQFTNDSENHFKGFLDSVSEEERKEEFFTSNDDDFEISQTEESYFISDSCDDYNYFVSIHPETEVFN